MNIITNKIIVKKNHAVIQVYKNGIKTNDNTIISIEDVELCMMYNWYLNGKYFRARINNKHVCLHRFIMSYSIINKGLIVDHIDRNRLNNKRSNLRIVTPSQSSMNRNKGTNNKSGYKGVHWYKTRKKWVASIYINKRNKSLGRFDNIIDAAKAYNEAAKKLHKEYAVLNTYL